MVAAYFEQRSRLLGQAPQADMWTGAMAQRFRDDPRRPLDTVLEALVSYLEPDDVVIDVGGGAGRLGLPLALRCRELVNVDPSAGMKAEFDKIVDEAGIKNARYVQQDWLETEGVEGHVVLAAHVTYFVPDILRFVEKLSGAARRRVIINSYSVPPPNAGAHIFSLVHGEPLASVPGYREFVPVLWEMGILPDVRIVQPPQGETRGALGVFPTREAAVEAALIDPSVRPSDADRVRAAVREHFEEVFEAYEGGFRRRFVEAQRPIVVTWETVAQTSAPILRGP